MLVPPGAMMLRFVGTTGDGWASDMAVDAVVPSSAAVQFTGLPCDFELDTCLWFNRGNSSWRRVSGQANDGTWFVEAVSENEEPHILESLAFDALEKKTLSFAYQLVGSSSTELQLDYKPVGGDWTSLFLQRGDHSSAWHSTLVRVPDSAAALRFVASTRAGEAVRVDSLVVGVSSFAAVTCDFESDLCAWWGNWQRNSGPTETRGTGPDAAFRGQHFVHVEGHDPGVDEQIAVTLTSPVFPATTGTAYLEFAYHMHGGGIGTLALQFLRSGLGTWHTRWSRRGTQGTAWQQAKVSLPKGTAQLRFVSYGAVNSDTDVSLDAIVAWLADQRPKFLSLCAGGHHNCALLHKTGEVKCWGHGGFGALGSSSTANVGYDPNEMGAALPPVDLAGARAVQVACGWDHSCAVLQGGALRCWGRNDYGQLGAVSPETIGDQAEEMGSNLSTVDVGANASVLQVACGQWHTCALLQGGLVKCFGYAGSGALGLGDSLLGLGVFRGLSDANTF